MKYNCTLIAVRDMARSKQFYCGLLEMEVTADFGANVTLSDCVALQTLDTWKTFLHREETEITLGHNAAELYFEESDMDRFLEKLASYPGIEYVHPPKEHAWGQRVVRFYDPDRNIIEVGEEMTTVARRFAASGMTPEQVAARMDVPIGAVRHWLAE
ncbi:VOC family protein [Caproiciproducens sp. R1]|uniref:VOC family protein n=1 Tax=Caproiciproducens sp. R1 TaxID=3435000 RepID=UPI0040344A7F